MACFQKAVEADPRNVEALKGLGFLLDQLGRHAEAQALYRQAIQVAPNDPDLQAK
jgi:Flp pilus assembly protein TadD